MTHATVWEECRAVNTSGAVSLLVKQSGSAVADALEKGLRAAGLRVVVAPSAFDTVIEAARAAGARHLLVGVDYFGPEEFRLLPLFRREWPDTMIVAYHGPGFEHKGRIAELVGADLVVSRPGEVTRFLETLGTGEAAGPGEPARAEPPTTPRHRGPEPPAPGEPPVRQPAAGPPEPSIATPMTAGRHRRGAAGAGAPPRPDSPPATPSAKEQAAAGTRVSQDVDPPGGDEEPDRAGVFGTIELTDEELRILLGEDDDT